MFGLFTLIEASLLVLNAIAVLHEERFLKKFGFADDSHQGFGEPGIKVPVLRTTVRIIYYIFSFKLSDS